MRRLAFTLLGVLVATAPLAACGKKGDPESDPKTYQRIYPKPDRLIPNPPTAQPAPAQPAPVQPAPVQPAPIPTLPPATSQ